METSQRNSMVNDMSDELTDEERRMIDDAIARGLLKRIPPGVSSHSGYVFDGIKLVAVDPQENPLRARQRRDYEFIRKRRENVLRLFNEGLTKREIAANLGIARKTVENDAVRLGIRFDGK